jgi:AraC-like DNA-binding protein
MGQINFYDGQRFEYIDPTDENIFPLKNYHGNYHLYFDRYDHIWLKNKLSVTCVDLVTERFVNSVESVFKGFGIKQNVTDMFVDQDGIVWLLTDGGLFNSKTKKTLKIRKDLNLQDLEIYKGNTLLLFYENGLVEMYEMPTAKKIHESYAYGPQDMDRFRFSSVLKVDGNKIYQIRNGFKDAILNQFDVEKRQWKEVLRTPYHLNNMTDRDSVLYIPSEYGYWTYDVVTDKLTHADNLRLVNGQTLNTDINVMAFDNQGGLWAGTERRGLLYSMPYTPPFTIYDWSQKRAAELGAMMDGMDKPVMFRHKFVNTVYKDSRGWTWVGTSQGLQLYRKLTDMLPQVITKKDGLLNNVIHSVVEDKQHNIWVATSYGISCLTFKGDKIRYIIGYNHNENLPRESFVNGKAMCLPSGELVMQSLDHVLVFNPKGMKTVSGEFPFKLYPKLIRLQVNGNEIDTGQEYEGDVILDKALSWTEEINLNYTQNSTTLVFSALNYFRPQQTCYRVRVKGLMDDWHVYTRANSAGLIDARGMFHLPLMSLSPGTYTIELQASMVPDRWDTEPLQWVVKINEPWWRTTGLFSILGLLLLVLTVINTYLFHRNYKLRAQRNRGEQTIIRRICTIARRLSTRGEIVLEPTSEEMRTGEYAIQEDIDPQFVKVMERLVSFVNKADKNQLSMRVLSSESGLNVQDFYRVVSDNVFKSPRLLYRKMMLDRATKLLKMSSKSVSEIADECGFVSPNYFISTFYRVHQMTPKEFREAR